MIGVSPAYFLSRCGPGFGPAEMVSALPFLSGTGYESFQAEVFLEAALPLWTGPATRALAESAKAGDLHCCTFVAHFLGAVFTSGSTLAQGLPLELTKAAVSIAGTITAPGTTSTRSSLEHGGSGKPSVQGGQGRIFVLPLPAFARAEATAAGIRPDAGSVSRFRDLVGSLSDLCNAAGLQLAIELLPGNILGGSAEFLSLTAEPGFSGLGLLFDTGHFWAMGEQVQDIPARLGPRIVATHLCDNNGIVNLSLCPGDGTIPFPATIKALDQAAYSGSMDIEIVCSKDEVETGYRRALSRFKQLSAQAWPIPDHRAEPDCGAEPERKGAAGDDTNQQSHKETI